MSEKDLARALLEGQKQIDVEALTQRILRRDRRRIWILGVICVIAWMAVVIFPWATILPMMAKLAKETLGPTTEPLVRSHAEASLLAIVLRQGTIAAFLSSIVCMFVAAICTVSLIILSRRATLRQINARLADIAMQLRK